MGFLFVKYNTILYKRGIALMALESSGNYSVRCCSMLLNPLLLWFSYCCFKTFCMNWKTDHYFTREECSLQVFSFEHWKISILSIAQLLWQNSLQGLHPKRSHSSPTGKWGTPALTPSFSPGGCWVPCKIPVQDVPGFTNQCSLSQPRAALCLCSSCQPGAVCTHTSAVLWLGCVPSDSLVQDTAIARTVLWSVGGWFSLVFLGDWVFILSFDLSCHSLLGRSVEYQLE